MIEILRLKHRIKRDPRISTHLALVARAFGANKLYYTGEKDQILENTIKKITKTWGNSFSIKYEKNALKLIKTKKNFKIINLTMYGLPLKNKIKEIREHKNLLIIVGGAKVPIEFYKLSNYNISITSQPHSEIAALAIFLHQYFQGKEKTFKNVKLKIIPQKSGKKLKT